MHMEEKMYKTQDELQNFNFEEAYIDEIRMNLDTFIMTLENVKILPENSCNRDIRLMRTNDITVSFQRAKIKNIVEEGFKRYDADGKLIEEVTDIEIEEEKYTGLLKSFEGSTIYSIEKNKDEYVVLVDAPEHLYDISISANQDIEEWERFINV